MTAIDSGGGLKEPRRPSMCFWIRSRRAFIQARSADELLGGGRTGDRAGGRGEPAAVTEP